MNEHIYYPVYECAILGIPRKSITVLIKETEERKKEKRRCEDEIIKWWECRQGIEKA